MDIENDWINKQRRRLSIKKRHRHYIFEKPASGKDNKDEETPLEKWRRIARSIMTQNAWTRQCTVKLSTDSEKEPMRRTKDRIQFNPNHFKSHVHLGRLSEKVKLLFTKPTVKRTQKDTETLFLVVDKLTCFATYPRIIRQKLTKFVYYSKFEANRIVVRQGHRSLSSYYIIQGSVAVIVEEKDKNDTTGNTVRRNLVGEMTEGDSFDDYALLQGTERGATVVCKVDAEFLRVDKEDFDQVVREVDTRQREDRMNHLKSMSLFQNWSTKELDAANAAFTLVEYPENTIIEKSRLLDTVHLITSGECVLVKEMTLLKRTYPFGREKLILPPDDGDATKLIRLKENESLLKYFLVIRKLKKGDFLSVGENCKDSYVITKGRRTELMVMPRSILHAYNRGKTLKIMRCSLSDVECSRREIFNAFIQTRRWNNYKMQLVEDILSENPYRNSATYRDVPSCIREGNTQFYRNSIPYNEMKTAQQWRRLTT